MTIEQFNALKAQHDTAVRAMKDAANALATDGLTEARQSELNATFEKAEKDQESAYQSLKRAEKVIEAERRAADEFAQKEEREGRKDDKRDANEEDAKYKRAFVDYMINGEMRMSRENHAILSEKRGTNTQIVGTDSLGGFGVPNTLSNRLIETMKAYGGILNVCDTLLTSGGGALNFATNNDTSAKAVLVAESGSSTVQDTTFGQKTLNAYMYRDLMKASYELLQDSEIDIEAFINRSMGVRFGRAANESLTVADGSSKPNGVVTASTLGKTAAATAAVTMAEILDLVHSVDPEYRRNARFMMNDSTLLAIKKLSIGSSDARPLWMPSFVAGEPATIDGYQYEINQDMASLGAAAKVILFGDFKYYLARIVRSLFIVRANELHIANAQYGYYGFARWDGDLLDTAAVKHLITAAS